MCFYLNGGVSSERDKDQRVLMPIARVSSLRTIFGVSTIIYGEFGNVVKLECMSLSTR